MNRPKFHAVVSKTMDNSFDVEERETVEGVTTWKKVGTFTTLVGANAFCQVQEEHAKADRLASEGIPYRRPAGPMASTPHQRKS